MSGRNQHHFWQVLQRGFGTERKPKYTTVFVYHENTPPFQVGTRNFGAERDFFDFSPGSGADSLITSVENRLQGLVKYFQNGGQVTAGHTIEISELITHLETRTKFLRQHLAETVSDLLGDLKFWFSDPRLIKKFMKKYATDNPDEINTLLAPHIQDIGTRTALTAFIIDNFDMLDAGSYQFAANDSTQPMNAIADSIFEFAKQGHIKAILNTKPDSARQNRYLSLKYRLQTGFSGNLICPDTMVAFLTDRKPKPFLDKADRLEAVWVPLSADLMLIGEPSTKVDRTSREILRILASTSYQAFIANSDTPDFRKLSSRIGKNAHVVTNTEIAALKRDILAGLS
ncbi:hypothetical protein [Pararhodobacter sp.]|uniref:hypothetical protein n=1 Tax=Pararhodobacter sp. TaxID=2127056 RepID=UPI002AFEED71|nr:hypothetical protein [Pararhodobacter sp.]